MEKGNTELLEKVQSLKRNRQIWIVVLSNVYIGRDLENMTIVQVLTKEEYSELYRPYRETEDRKRKELSRK